MLFMNINKLIELIVRRHFPSSPELLDNLYDRKFVLGSLQRTCNSKHR